MVTLTTERLVGVDHTETAVKSLERPIRRRANPSELQRQPERAAGPPGLSGDLCHRSKAAQPWTTPTCISRPTGTTTGCTSACPRMWRRATMWTAGWTPSTCSARATAQPPRGAGFPETEKKTAANRCRSDLDWLSKGQSLPVGVQLGRLADGQDGVIDPWPKSSQATTGTRCLRPKRASRSISCALGWRL